MVTFNHVSDQPSIFGTSSFMLARMRFLSVPSGRLGSKAVLISNARVSVSRDCSLSLRSIAILIEAASRALYVALNMKILLQHNFYNQLLPATLLIIQGQVYIQAFRVAAQGPLDITGPLLKIMVNIVNFYIINSIKLKLIKKNKVVLKT